MCVCFCVFTGYSSYPNYGSRHVHPANVHDGTSHPAAKPSVPGQHGHSQYQSRSHNTFFSDTYTHTEDDSGKKKVLVANCPEIHKVNCSCQILHTLCVSSLPSLQYIPANSTMQGTYIPQYTPVPPSSVQEV